MNKEDAPIFRALIAAGLYTPDSATPRMDLSDLPSAPSGDAAAARYAEKALEYEADAVAHATEGSRNDTLNSAAFKLGSLVAAGHLDGQTMIDTLVSAAQLSGLPATEIHRVVYRAARDGSAEPRQVKLQPNHEIAPAWTLTPDEQPAEAAEAVTEQDEDGEQPEVTTAELAEQAAQIAALYPPLDWREVWARAPDEVEWLAYPVIERRRMYALYSPAKAGKSLLALDICASLATGRGVFGQSAGEPQTVVYVDLENDPIDLVDRLTEFGYEPDELDRLVYLSYPTLPALDSRIGGAHLLTTALHHRADVVVIDTVSRVISGGENDSDTFHALYRHALAPLKSAGVTVIRLDHSGKDEERGMRGSSAKYSDADVVWKLSRPGFGRIRLDCVAARNNHHPDYVVLDQQTGPLRHVLLSDTSVPDHVAQVLRTLERLGIPQDWGRERVRTKLIEAGIKVRNSTLAEALRARRTTFEDEGRAS